MKHTPRTFALCLALGATSLFAASLGGIPDATAAEWLRPSTAPSDRPATEVAERFIASEGRATLRLVSETLAHVSTTRLGHGSAVRFQQRYQGVLVDGRNVALRVGADGRVRTAMVDVARGLDLDITPNLTVDEARDAAAFALPFTIGERVRSELVVMTTSSLPHLAWRIDVLDARGGGRILIDAHDGTFRGYRTLASSARGLVYEQNVVTTPVPIEVTLDTLDTDANPIRLDGWDGLLQVTNYVSGSQQDSNYQVEQIVGPSAGEDFLYGEPSNPLSEDDEFSQVGLFYHLTEHRNFFRDVLGVDVDQDEFKLTAVANMQEGGQPLDNAFFSPAGIDPSGSDFDAPSMIGIGQGSFVDFASDSDVFKHEFGHYMSHQVVGYNLGQLGATQYGLSPHSGSVDEGISDYFACTENGDPILGEATLEPFGVGRHLDDTSKTCPTDMVGQVHADGELVGSLGWTLRENFGREIADPLVWGAVTLMPTGGTLGDFATGILETAQDLLEDGVIDEGDLAGIEGFIADRGMNECDDVIPLHGDEPRSTTMFGLDQVGQAFGASCDELRAFGLEVQSIFHFSGDAPAGASATFHVDMAAAAPGDLSYRLLVKKNGPIAFSNNGGPLPAPGLFDYEVASESASLDLVIDASSDPPFDPEDIYFAVVMSQNCPVAQLGISLRGGGSSGEGGSGASSTSGDAASGTTSAAAGPTSTGAGPTNDAAAGSGGGSDGDDATAEGDGCDCRATPGVPSSGAAALAVAGLGLVVARRRRRA